MSVADRQLLLGFDYNDRHQLTFELTATGRAALDDDAAGGGPTHISDVLEALDVMRHSARANGFDL